MSNGLKTIIVLMLLTALSGFFLWHNKINKTDKPTDPTYLEETMKSCNKELGRNDCLKNAAQSLLAHYSLSEILSIFEANEKKPEFFTNCHTIAHYLGQLEYKRLKSVKAVFLESGHTCLGGAYHGTIEGYFMEKGIINAPNGEIKSEVAQICGKPDDYERRQEFTECNHGLGHAVMYIADYDLPNALDLCDALRSQNERELCYSGALMANGDAFGSGEHPTKYIKADDPLYPCPILKKQQQRQCYTYGVLTRFQTDLDKSIDICLKIPKEFQEDCFETVGRDRTMISADPAELISQCSRITLLAFRNNCMHGSAYNLVVRFGLASTLAAEYCGLAEPSAKTDCYRNILSAAKELTSGASALKTFCETIKEQEYENQCIRSI